MTHMTTAIIDHVQFCETPRKLTVRRGCDTVGDIQLNDASRRNGFKQRTPHTGGSAGLGKFLLQEDLPGGRGEGRGLQHSRHAASRQQGHWQPRSWAAHMHSVASARHRMLPLALIALHATKCAVWCEDVNIKKADHLFNAAHRALVSIQQGPENQELSASGHECVAGCACKHCRNVATAVGDTQLTRIPSFTSIAAANWVRPGRNAAGSVIVSAAAAGWHDAGKLLAAIVG